jgi:hypothetical protein
VRGLSKDDRHRRHGVHGTIDANSVGQFTDGFDGILRAEIDNLGALILGHFEAR